MLSANHRMMRGRRPDFGLLTSDIGLLIQIGGELSKMIRPLGDKVVVEPLEGEDKSPGGIILPDTAKQKPQEGMVVAVGPGRYLDDGKRAEMAVKKGDKVIFAKYGGTEVTVGGKDLVILDQDSIFAIVE